MPHRVLIVGTGPTGLTAALELSRLGIPIRIIDKQSANAFPVAVSAFQRLGWVEETFRSWRQPWPHPHC